MAKLFQRNKSTISQHIKNVLEDGELQKEATISKWCTNTCQPDLGNLMKIAKLLEVEVADLLREDNID